MFDLPAKTNASSKADSYRELASQLEALLGTERDFIANAANTASLLFQSLPGLNWAGFYLVRSGELVLGPFQGKPACVRIAVGRGVCGTAVSKGMSIVVPDVHAFSGHIACDSASNSELVVPLIRNGQILGVLDLDSPQGGRFDDEDRLGCEMLARMLVGASDPF